MTTANDNPTQKKIKNDLEIDNLPNRLTILRVLLIPIVLFALVLSKSEWAWLGHHTSTLGWTAAWIFSLASITDFLDGYIARKRGIVTVFGSFLDPIADKFLVVSSLIMLQDIRDISPFIVIILILREMYMTSLRLLAQTEGLNVPVSNMAKWKTATQMVAIPFLMVSEKVWIFDLAILGEILLYISAFLSVLTALKYSKTFIVKLKQSRLERIEKRRLKKLAKMAQASEQNSQGN